MMLLTSKTGRTIFFVVWLSLVFQLLIHSILRTEPENFAEDNVTVTAFPQGATDLQGLQRRYRILWRLERYKHDPPKDRGNNISTSECGEFPDYTRYFRQSSKLRSRNDEDRHIYEKLFKSSSLVNGTYLEIGAYDGKQESNSRFFDKCLGWDGILIEPNPSIYPQLLPNRPHAHKLSFAPSCSEEEEVKNKTIGFHPYPYTNAAQSDTHNVYENKTEVQVPCGSLAPVLIDLFPGRNITFFSLDVEGAEPHILENLDFGNVFIHVLLVENTNFFYLAKCESRDAARRIMEKAGYKRYTGLIPKSDLYIHPNSPYQLDALK